MRLQARFKMFRIVLNRLGHPTSRFYRFRSHVVIRILLIMAPRVIANDRVDFQQPKERSNDPGNSTGII